MFLRAFAVSLFLGFCAFSSAQAAPTKNLEVICDLVPQFDTVERHPHLYDLVYEAKIAHNPRLGRYEMVVKADGDFEDLHFSFNEFRWRKQKLTAFEQETDTVVELFFNRRSREFVGQIVLDEDFLYRANCQGTQSLIDGQRR